MCVCVCVCVCVCHTRYIYSVLSHTYTSLPLIYIYTPYVMYIIYRYMLPRELECIVHSLLIFQIQPPLREAVVPSLPVSHPSTHHPGLYTVEPLYHDTPELRTPSFTYIMLIKIETNISGFSFKIIF